MGEHDHEDELIFNAQVMVILFSLFLSFMVSHLLRKFNITWFPESGATVSIGILVGVGVVQLGNFYQVPLQQSFDSRFFFIGLLPVIIFESGFAIHKNRLFKYFGGILSFAIFGTVISMVVTAFMMWGILFYGFGKSEMTFIDYFIFGALISSTDPVAALAVFGNLGANKMLESLVFGESVLNDAIAVTMFKTLEKVATTHEDAPYDAVYVFTIIGQFLLIAVGSTLIGIVICIFTSFFLRRTKIKRHHEPIDLIIFILFGYLSYAIADSLSLSGIVSIFFYGLTARHYVWYTLSPTSRDGSLIMLETLKTLSEQAIFLILGLSIPQLVGSYDWLIIGFAIISCLVARALHILIVSLILNCFRKKEKITMKMQIVMWIAGLRGAVSIALAVNTDSPNKDTISSTAHIVVLFTIYILGTLTAPLLKMLNLVDKNEPVCYHRLLLYYLGPFFASSSSSYTNSYSSSTHTS
eukprot:TRINITY_DN3380_c1_g1_i1.p1 TRINITY_DN3380_c1_g1~~TRINITY_DN3380_c1_g1_i1.p1  ORF type:complete len:468 (-),score=53.11 TRINITY_DN3380_c1_g1_i1:50-1453(-)